MNLSSAVAQEGVSNVSKYIVSKLDDVASRGSLATRLEVALSDLELALERSRKLPITDVSLLRRRKILKQAYIEGTDLLNKQKQLLEGREEVGLVVRTSSFFKRSVLSLLGLDKGYLSPSSVQRFANLAESACKFLSAVESGCSLRPDIISHSILKHLFDQKTLGYGVKTGTFLRSASIIWATISERGVEASLVYMYEEPKMPEKSFLLKLGLRLSESTDIFGTAIKCLQPLVSQFKVAAESAIGELIQQATYSSNLQDQSTNLRSHALVPLKNHCVYSSQSYRPDPVCCMQTEHGPSSGNKASSELSHMLPEEVTFLEFNFHVLLPKKYSLRRSSNEEDKSNMLPLEVEITFMPHMLLGGVFLELVGLEQPMTFEVGSNNGHRKISIREVLDTVGSTARDSFLQRPELTRFNIFWFSKHGGVSFDVKKPTNRRSVKRKR